MECPYCNYVSECDEESCEQGEIYEDYLDDINDFY